MLKLLFLCDGKNFPRGAFNLIKGLYAGHASYIKGVFADAQKAPGLWLHPVDVSGDIVSGLATEQLHRPNKISGYFKDLCLQNNLLCTVKQYTILSASQLKEETTFADVMIMGKTELHHDLAGNMPNEFTRNLLHASNCPVLLVPDKFIAPANIVLMYDGSRNSMIAIKQFSQLFHHWCTLPATILFVGKAPIPAIENMKEWAAQHFPQLSITQVGKNAAPSCLSNKEGDEQTILVAGAYGRSKLSTILKKSFINNSFQNDHTAIFIAHG